MKKALLFLLILIMLPAGAACAEGLLSAAQGTPYEELSPLLEEFEMTMQEGEDEYYYTGVTQDRKKRVTLYVTGNLLDGWEYTFSGSGEVGKVVLFPNWTVSLDDLVQQYQAGDQSFYVHSYYRGDREMQICYPIDPVTFNGFLDFDDAGKLTKVDVIVLNNRKSKKAADDFYQTTLLCLKDELGEPAGTEEKETVPEPAEDGTPKKYTVATVKTVWETENSRYTLYTEVKRYDIKPERVMDFHMEIEPLE